MLDYAAIQERLLEWLTPQPASARERELADELGHGDYEIYRQKLDTALDEAHTVFERTGVSSMLKSGDVVVGLHNEKGDLVSASCGTYIHGPIAQLPVKFLIDRYVETDRMEINPGDIFYANEALIGGLHNPDQMAIMPVFQDDELIAWCSAALHQAETGAIEPGGRPLTARTRYDEGMRLTPIKIGENYEIRPDLMDMMVNFISRSPWMQEIDTRARCTAVDKLRQRVEEIAEEKGAAFVRGLFCRTIRGAEAGARERVKNWPDGTYRDVAFYDTIGYDEGLVKLSLAVTKRGESVALDFSGTSPECGSYNMFAHGIAAFMSAYLFPYVFPDLPVSTGVFTPFSFDVPDGSVLNADPESAVCNCVFVGRSVTGLCHNAFTRMLFATDGEQTAASPGTHSGSGAFTGTNQHGVKESNNFTYTHNTDGGGARTDLDGVDAFGFFFSPWGKATNAEQREESRIFLGLTRGHHEDTAGFGEYRGGSGSQNINVVTGDAPVEVNSNGKGTRIPQDVGLFGGYAPTAQLGISVTDTDVLERLAAGEDVPTDVRELVTDRVIDGDYHFEPVNRATRTLDKGDVFVLLSSGGGAIGDPLDRAPDDVLADVRRGIVSEWTARNVFQVALADESVDESATERRRAETRERRVERGRPYEEFVADWERRRPPEEALEYYGEWPAAMVADAPLATADGGEESADRRDE